MNPVLNIDESFSLPIVTSTTLRLILNRILLSFAAKMDIRLNQFVQDDINTYYFVNGKLARTYKVKEQPDVLGYNLEGKEKGKSAAQLFDAALDQVGWRRRRRRKKAEETCSSTLSHDSEELVLNILCTCLISVEGLSEEVWL